MKKYQNFYLKIYIFLVVKFSIYLNRRVFVMQIWFSPAWSKKRVSWEELIQEGVLISEVQV